MASPLDSLEARHGNSSWRRWARLAALATAAFGAWSYVAKLDEVAIARGEVVPRDKVKIIQHLEGGIIERIYVGEGDQVAAGDALVEIRLPVTSVNKNELQVRMDALKLAAARLGAEVEGRALSLPEALVAERPELAAAERQVYASRQAELAARIAALEDQISQRRIAIDELNAAIAAMRADLAMARDNLKMSADLVRDGLTSRMDHLAREREVKLVEGQLAARVISVPRSQAALSEGQQQLREERSRFTRAAFEELGRVETDMARTLELLSDADQREQRRVIKAPNEGVVKNIRYHTIGGVVRSGDPIMELVPSDGDLVIEARLSPADRGYVVAGQKARAKISTYDFTRFGALDGTVVQISPDSLTDAEGRPYYQVLMQPERVYLGRDATEQPLMPGMVATVDIKTGQKTVLQFLTKPLVAMGGGALRER